MWLDLSWYPYVTAIRKVLLMLGLASILDMTSGQVCRVLVKSCTSFSTIFVRKCKTFSQHSLAWLILNLNLQHQTAVLPSLPYQKKRLLVSVESNLGGDRGVKNFVLSRILVHFKGCTNLRFLRFKGIYFTIHRKFKCHGRGSWTGPLACLVCPPCVSG